MMDVNCESHRYRYIMNDGEAYMKRNNLILKLYKDLAANESSNIQGYIKMLIKQLEDL